MASIETRFIKSNNVGSHSTNDYRTPGKYRAELLNQASGGGKDRITGPDLSLKFVSYPPPTTI
jgi:hypothetical protein